MFYAVRHFNRYRYSRPVWQSMMEVRMHPRSEHLQRCFTFQLAVSPRSRIFSYTDHMGNLVHHFDIPAQHRQLTIIADSLVEVDPPDPLPPALGTEAWADLDRMVEQEDYWDMLRPSYFARPSPELDALAREFGVHTRGGRDPLQILQELNSDMYEAFSYTKSSTNVDSPIEDALQSRQGVCQDFAHIMIALVRGLRIPCRYVSGYLYHAHDDHDRSAEGATHAWVEALLPGLGWLGFDPTNNLLAGIRHIRTAIGRDYADVSPTHGVMKGSADTELQVRVRVTPSEALLPPDQEFAADEEWSKFLEKDQESELMMAQQQQQQQ
jgi:transglutaminase-like putative cysteine protease